MRIPVVFTVACFILNLSAAPQQPQTPAAADWAPPAVRHPSALVSDPGDAKAYLEWNPSLEENLAGYHVYRQDSARGPFHRVTAKPLARPEFIDSGLSNGQSVRYRVTTLLKSGVESAPSNIIEVTPRPTQAPQVVTGAARIEVPGYDPIDVRNAITVRFENGHRIVFDRFTAKVRDWVSGDGTHLLYPRVYGNPIDITEMDDMGFPVAQPATKDQPAIPPQINLNYARGISRRGSGGINNPMVWFVGTQVADNRITFQYRIPLTGPGVPPGSSSDLNILATIWETWIPVERRIDNGATYRGLARKIELDMPSYFEEGYSLCLNDGFGPNGSADRGVTFELKWNNQNFLTQVKWEKGKDAKGEGRPRATAGFHPSDPAVQVMPFLLAQFPQGTLILAPRRYYYSTTYALTNYAAQDQDGLWPNYTIDADASGARTSIETFEYLWTADNSLPMPQKFIDATFHYRRNLAGLYNLNRNLTSLSYAWDNWGPGEKAIQGKTFAQSLDVLRQWGEDTAARAKEVGADRIGGAHEVWTSSPYTVGDEIRLNPQAPVNRAIAGMVAAFHKKGVQWGYWVRPEFIKMPLPTVLSTHFYTQYYGYVRQLFPPAIPLVEDHGLELVRRHPEWIRLGKKGAHPSRTPYNWTPASFTKKGWYEEVVYKDLVMMKKLGYDSAFQDGGGTNLAGVDYTSGRARANMPYYWRFYEDMAQLGMDLNGECPSGWGNNTLPIPSREDQKELWAFTHSIHRGNLESPFPWYTPEMRYRANQLYIGAYMNMRSSPEHAAVARFARLFLDRNGHPDRIVLDGLRWDDARQEWIWDRVFWEYHDGRRVQFPNYAEFQALASVR